MEEREREAKTGRKMNLVTSGMTENAVKQRKIAKGCTSATNAEREDIEERNVKNNSVPKCPKYLECSVWTDADASPSFSPTACSMLTDKPLPRPPAEEFLNSDALDTIKDNPHLFKIITPINILQFKKLLDSHPNKAFVQSVCTSLHDGFWPWANTQKEDYPVTWDFSERPPKTECEADFLREQRDIEVNAGRYSEDFGTDLLLGMYSTPVHAIPKPRSEKL